ncbi:putative ribonuclease H-like domain-containing protein [Tanacetum coccineum]
MIPQAILMRSGLKTINTARSRATVNAAKPKEVHNASKRNRFHDVKASACRVWKPKNRVIDHGRNITEIDQDPGISLVKHDVEIQGRHEHEPEFGFDAANIPVTTTGAKISTASPEVKIAGDSIKDIAAETLVYIRRSAAKVKDKGLKTAGYRVTTAGSRLLLLKEYKEKGVIDSGCSRHMTGNKYYLDEYKDYDGGFVSFGDGKGSISGKGKIKTGSLDFDDMYFCKELKYNMFSVLQICDKKNNILFTDTECHVLSSNFKLLDKSQVLLRVPRKDNIYSVDLKSVVPTGGLTCLIAKATIDESNTWHRRLGHINFKTMNKLVKGNLVKGLPSKIFENDHSCVACQKGKQHKASYKTKLMNSISKPLHMLHMDLFGPTNVKSLMKKSYCLVVTDDFSRFSWNGIAERKNRILIEASRTVVVDSKLPTTFWAEAVNTACYVLNRVLVIKPYNKTTYELIRGRPLLIDFMKPFRCPVTILNTRDHLGKFKGKADEGYFVGYSMVSKAMRVFNKRTRIVEETLNIRFLENTTNVKGNGPNWLSDVDSLLISMNYVPVVAGNKTNCIAGTKDNIVAGQAQKEKEPKQEYILIPLCITDPLISQGSKDCEGDARMKPTEVDKNEASDKSGKHDQEARSESERINKREMQTEHTNSSNGINTVSTPVSTARPSFDNVVPSTLVNTAGPYVSTANESDEQLFKRFSPFKNAFTLPLVPNISSMDNTGIFGNAYDDEDMEEEVDMNNVISSYTVPDTSFTKFHKDHPEDQVIRSLKTPIQTRHMTKTNEEHGLISLVHKLRRTNHKDFQNCLFVCFLSQMEPKKPVQALKDPSWVEAMQDEFLQFKLLKVWTLVDLPRDKWAIGTKWMFRNKKDERGIVVKHKARLVAQGHTQEEGIDYDEVFAPVAKIEAIRLLLAYASFKDFVVYQMDVKSAFLYGKIEEEVYVYQPPGFEDPHFPDKVYKVKQKSDGIFISQDKYVAEILKKFDFASVKTASTPMETNKALVKDEETEDVDVHLYRSMIGSLMYFLDQTLCLLFVLVQDSPFNLEAFFDSDYAGASLDKKSTTRGCQFLGKRLISWQCKKQTIVANSTTEAEYVAAANCCGQNPVSHSKTKHIEIRHYFIRDTYEKKLIQVIKIHTDQNVADLLTKAFDDSRKHIEFLVGDEAVHKELGGRMERAATTTSSFEAESQNTILGVVDAQTRFETASKQFNDPPFSKVNTFGSGEDSMQLMELMAHCIKLCEFVRKKNREKCTTEDGVHAITATIDGRDKIITEASIRRHLKLQDSEGLSSLPSEKFFKQLASIGYATTSNSEAPSTSPPRITSSPSLSSHHTLPSTPNTPPSFQTIHESEETVTMPYDLPLPGGHTTGSDEGRLKHDELIELVTELSDNVVAVEEDLKQTKKTYSTALTKLVLKVKKLEKQVRSSKARKRARIVLLEDEDAAEDPSKQGRKIAQIDIDPTISLVQDEGTSWFYEDVETREKNSADTEVLLEEETLTKLIEDLGSGKKGEKEINTADVPVSTADAEVSTTSHDVSTVAAALVYIRRSASKAKDKGKSIMQELEPLKKLKKRVQVQMSIDEVLARKVQEEEQAKAMAEQE